MVFQNMAVIHPGTRTVIGKPGNLNLCFRRDVIGILPCSVFRDFTIFFDNLEEKTMQMKGMIHAAGIVYFPNLQFSNLYRFVVYVHIIIYFKIDSTLYIGHFGELYCSCN